MKVIGIVYGSEESAQPVVIGKDTVYVHTDIEPIGKVNPKTGEITYQYKYHEVQYDKDEYLQLMVNQNKEQEVQITDLQLALVTIYENLQ